jgi:hypothetical protein
MNVPRVEKKQVFIKPYNQISDLEKAFKTAYQMNFDKVSISVIGNVGDSVLNDGMVLLVKEKKMQSFFNDLLGRQAKFETFYNPELGHLYVVGFLVPTFLNVIGKKTIGVLPGGPFGVLRGLGISEKEATSIIQLLGTGTSFLIARGDAKDIEMLKSVLI